LGFGPFRWVCTSGDSDDLRKTDELAAHALKNIIHRESHERGDQIGPRLPDGLFSNPKSQFG
jgi:urocanate hydratase